MCRRLCQGKAQYQSLVSQYFRNAIGREMEMRGCKRASEADLLIDVSARLDEKIRVTLSPSTRMYYGHGYRSSRYGFYIGHSTQTDVRQYTEGTVTIDLSTENVISSSGLAYRSVQSPKTTAESARKRQQRRRPDVSGRIFVSGR